MKYEQVFEQRFKCNSQIYEELGFGDYNNFIENYAKYCDKEYETCGRPNLLTV